MRGGRKVTSIHVRCESCTQTTKGKGVVWERGGRKVTSIHVRCESCTQTTKGKGVVWERGGREETVTLVYVYTSHSPSPSHPPTLTACRWCDRVSRVCESAHVCPETHPCFHGDHKNLLVPSHEARQREGERHS